MKTLKVSLALLAFVFATLLGGYFYAKNKMETVASHRFSKLRNLASFYVDVKYQSLEADVFRRKISVRGITVQPNGSDRILNIHHASVVLDWDYLLKVGLGRIDDTKDFPKLCEYEVGGIDVPFEQLSSELRESFTAMGYKTLNLTLKSLVAMDTANEILRFRIGASAHAMGELSFAFELGDVDLGKITSVLSEYESSKKWTSLAALAALSLRHAEIKYSDFSLVPRVNYRLYQLKKTTLLNEYKKSQAMLEERQNFMRLARDMASTPAPESPLKAEAEKATERFLQQPKSISIQMAPPTPIPVMRLAGALGMSEAEIIDLLKIKVVAE